MRSAGIVSVVLMLAVGSAALHAQQVVPSASAGVAALQPPFKTITYSPAKTKMASDPFFSHGYIIQFKHSSASAEESTIYLWNSSGQLEHEIAIWPAGTDKLSLTSVDVGVDSQLAFAGRATKTDGSLFAFIATSNLAGENPRYFTTGDYLPTQIARADDGSIWAIGAEHSEDEQIAGVTTKKWANYDTLRHYSSTGVLIEHFLSRWGSGVAYITKGAGNGAFKAYNSQGNAVASPYLNPDWGYQNAWAASSFLRSSGTQTVLYDGLREQLCKRDTVANTFSCETVTGTYADLFSLTGFAFLSNGDVLASMKGDEPDLDDMCGLFFLAPQTSGSGSQWILVPGTKSDRFTVGDFLLLLGSDGDSLIYSRTEAKGDTTTVVYESRSEK